MASVDGAASRARACPKRLPAEVSAHGERAPLVDKPDVAALLRAGREGHPQRVRLLLDHPLASCECPNFAVAGYLPSSGDDPSSYAQVMFPAPLPEAHRYEPTKRYARTKYDVTGYFSGREVDVYEWHRLQYGTDPPAPDDEQRYYWKEKSPEFCVESYCVIPDLTRDRVLPVFRTPEYKAKYDKVLAEMRAAGVVFCPKS